MVQQRARRLGVRFRGGAWSFSTLFECSLEYMRDPELAPVQGQQTQNAAARKGLAAASGLLKLSRA